ncbi:MAG: hypothetical protein HOP12_09620 [Candidatus Eisenbacteria bacterium]|uniref:Uncharacterized protein n=1 Tax=Eiseniibacteriota bacterium TaxID=2212470 RepID=A0A849SP53_UNCEI|nr:hypothetical protein [Candidatus Eisenbacteria bacterium]
MSESTRVVAHMNDGRILKGTTQDFFPNRVTFHLLPRDGAAAIELRCKHMKAMFFVKEFDGNPTRRDIPGFVAAPPESSQGKKIAVRFKDGELLCGYSLSYLPDREGFFMFPADALSNNKRIYVVAGSASEIKAGPAADALAQRVLEERGPTG